MLSNQPADKIGGNHGRIRHRLIELPGQQRQQVRGGFAGLKLHMLGGKMPRDQSGVLGLVVLTMSWKADCEGLYLRGSPYRHSRDQAGIHPTAEQNAHRDIGHQLRCMVCQNESVEESEADLARDFRRIIRERVHSGQTDQQVMDWMVARYGDFIRLRPPFSALTLLLWGAPVVAVGIGAGAVLLGRRPVPPAPLTEAERQRLAKLTP